jgi:hypothetical protein
MPHKPHRNPHPGVMDKVYESLTVKTPCYGLAMRRTPDGAAVIRFHYSADPTMTPARLAEIKKRFLSDEGRWAREMEMDVNALSGQLIYPEFNPEIHVVDDDDVPPLLTRYMAIDPHPRTPYAFLWLGVDRYNDVWVYRDYWPSKVYGLNKRIRDTEEEPQYTTKEYVEVVAALEGNRIEWVQEGDGWYGRYVRMPGGEEIVYRYMDQAGKAFKVSAEGTPIESIASRFRDYGMPCMDPYKIHKAGEDAIRELLRPRRWEDKWWPRLHVARSCRELIWEFQNLRYAPTRGDIRIRELNQEPVKARSHSLDLLRYLATSPIDWIPNLAS